MRSPGFNRIIHTRTRSLSETSSLPTHGLGFFCSRSNSAAISCGHADLSELSACLSNIVSAMAFLLVASIYSKFRRFGNGGIERIVRVREQASRGGRRLDERPVGRAAAAALGLGGRYLRAR